MSNFRCDADPEALARYVLALLKKEKPLKELQQCMGEQLDVFLGEQTKPFIGELFDVIGSGVYLQGADKTNDNTTTEPGQPLDDAKVSVGATANAVLDKADASRITASRPANETHQRLNRRTSPARATDNHTIADNSTDYVSCIFFPLHCSLSKYASDYYHAKLFIWLTYLCCCGFVFLFVRLLIPNYSFRSDRFLAIRLRNCVM